MSFKIYFSHNLPKEKWSQLTDNSIYFDPVFADAWKSMKGKPVYLVDERDNYFVAGMPGIMFGKSVFRRFQSMPDGFRGGPIFADGYSDEDRLGFINNITDWLKSMNVMRADIHFPYNEIDSIYFARRENTTHVIHLKGGKYNPPGQNLRNHIAAAHKRGGEVVSPMDKSKVDHYFRLAELTAKRHGKKQPFPKQFYEKILEIAISDDRIIWPVVEYKGNPVAYRICFISGKELTTWQYYSDKEFDRIRPGYLLLDYLIDFAIKNKLECFNLGGSPASADSVVRFKEKWGAVENKRTFYTYFGTIGKLLYRRGEN